MEIRCIIHHLLVRQNLLYYTAIFHIVVKKCVNYEKTPKKTLSAHEEMYPFEHILRILEKTRLSPSPSGTPTKDYVALTQDREKLILSCKATKNSEKRYNL